MNKNLLYKYFKGECTESETQQVLQWYAKVNADKELNQEIDEVFNRNVDNYTWDKEGTLKDILIQIEDKEGGFAEKKEILNIAPYRKKRPYFLVRVAAIVSFLLVACSLLWLLSHNKEVKQNNQLVVSSEIDYITKQTTKGQKNKLTLPDGSQIILNAASKLRFANSFSTDKERIVYLEGEAFFDVARDTSRPFVIYTQATATRVLGTSFNINAYRDNPAVSVAVVSGEVQVKRLESKQPVQPINLVSGEKAICDVKNEVQIKKTTFSYDREIVWKDGTLTFYKEDFETVAKKLEMWFGKKIIIQKKNIKNDFTGTYHNKSLKVVLEGISYVLDFDYVINEEKIIIK